MLRKIAILNVVPYYKPTKKIEIDVLNVIVEYWVLQSKLYTFKKCICIYNTRILYLFQRIEVYKIVYRPI